jgi:hypothetical protein
MIFTYRKLLLGLLFAISIQLQAQTQKKFTHETEKFKEEILQLINNPNKKKICKKFAADFPAFWQSAELTEENRKNIYSICDQFKLKKARAFPDFYNYFKTIMLFQKLNSDQQNYLNWEKGLQTKLALKKTKLNVIKNYLKQTQNLLQDSIINNNYNTKWKAKNAQFSYTFDKEVAINFSQVELYCYSQRDSIHICNTSGTFYPFQKKWIGKSGKVNWTRVGKQDEYVSFTKYILNTDKPYFNIDSVEYHNSKLFTEPIKGTFSEKVNAVRNPKNAKYPRFESFDMDIQIDNLYDHILFRGGVSILGAKFIGKGSVEHPSEIEVIRNDTIFMHAKSKHFSFKNNRITGNNTEVKIFLDTCQIYHPGLLFKYFPKKKEVNLVRDGEGSSQSPYFNNYHNLIMDFGMLVWQLDQNEMHFTSMKGVSNRTAEFESTNYFSMYRFRRIQGMDDQNALVLLRKFSDYNYTTNFTAAEYANYIKKPVSEVRQQIFALSFQGFITYDKNKDEITILPRLNDYILSSMEKKDYDVIRFKTNTESKESDAIYHIGNSNLQINGVQQIAVSDSQNVVIFPLDRKIILEKNRNFRFDGKVMAGLMDMYGKDFHFSYENFKIDLKEIDSLQINIDIDSTNNYGNKRYTQQLGSVLENISGDLLIDDPNNKSGLLNYPEYPIFNSADTCYVYYDKKQIQGGVYKRGEFFFKVDPYEMQNINDLKRDDLHLTGTFVSDSIFPTFREALKVQEDNSLGFAHITPPDGLSAYDKGVFTDTIRLSNQGLRGNGNLNYINSVTVSDDFIFHPKSATARAQTFDLQKENEQMNNPEIHGKEVTTRWIPLEDELYVQSNEVPIDMFEELSNIEGVLKITPKGVTGDGKMDLSNANLQSKYFSYLPQKINADTANFHLMGQDSVSLAFESPSVNSKIDFEKRTGSFSNTNKELASKFPNNQYSCNINDFMWYMDDQIIDIGTSQDNYEMLANNNKLEEIADDDLNKFMSTDPKQDSLIFYTPVARYNAKENIIDAKFVANILVADAKIHPDLGDVRIDKQGHMETFNNAKVIADTVNSFHTIYNAKINIHSRKRYSGSGSYTYIDRIEDEQKIALDVIDVDTTGQTIAMGNILEDDSFTLSPEFDFKGDIKLEARDSILKFTGQTHLHNQCMTIDDKWLDFSARIDPKEILIPVDHHVTDDTKRKLYNSFFLTNDTVRIYSSFLSRRNFYADNALLNAHGFLTYNEKEDAYQIASKDKLHNPDHAGNILSFYQNNCNIKGEGKIDLGTELGQIKQVAAGNIEHDLSSDIVTLDMMYAIDFFFSDPAIKFMTKQFENASIPKVNLKSESNILNLTHLLGQEKTTDLMNKITKDGDFKNLPKELEHTILFNNIDFIWDKESNSYQSVGDIKLGAIRNKQINKTIQGKIEINKKRSGNRLTMYLEVGKRTWFFFEYHHGVMFTRSSESEFNDIIANTKEKNRIHKDPLKKHSYNYILCERSKKTKFLKRFNLK